MLKIPKVVKLSKSEDGWKYGVWSGSIAASDEHSIGTPLGVVTARAVTALLDGQSLWPRQWVKCKALRGVHQLNIREPRSGHI